MSYKIKTDVEAIEPGMRKDSTLVSILMDDLLGTSRIIGHSATGKKSKNPTMDKKSSIDINVKALMKGKLKSKFLFY
jgi:hypothetical protein